MGLGRHRHNQVAARLVEPGQRIQAAAQETRAAALQTRTVAQVAESVACVAFVVCLQLVVVVAVRQQAKAPEVAQVAAQAAALEGVRVAQHHLGASCQETDWLVQEKRSWLET